MLHACRQQKQGEKALTVLLAVDDLAPACTAQGEQAEGLTEGQLLGLTNCTHLL